MTSTLTAVSQTQSLAAMRNFVRASVSCIAYARGLCSDASFARRTFLGMSLQYMLPTSHEAVTLSQWLEKGMFDALNRGYLREAALCVYDATCTRLLESYTFAFAYSEDGKRAALSLHTTASASTHAVAVTRADDGEDEDEGGGDVCTSSRRRRSKQEVQRMLSTIFAHLLEVVERLPPLLDERVLTMRLVYRDGVTPAHYEPPCFAPATQHMRRLYCEEQAHGVHLGVMQSGHHGFALTVRHPLLTRQAMAAAASTHTAATAATTAATTAAATEQQAAAHTHTRQRNNSHDHSNAAEMHGNKRVRAQTSSATDGVAGEAGNTDKNTLTTTLTYVSPSTSSLSTSSSTVVVPCFAQLVRMAAEQQRRQQQHQHSTHTVTATTTEAGAAMAATTTDDIVWTRETVSLALLACLVFARYVDVATTTAADDKHSDATRACAVRVTGVELQRQLHACAEAAATKTTATEAEAAAANTTASSVSRHTTALRLLPASVLLPQLVQAGYVQCGSGNNVHNGNAAMAAAHDTNDDDAADDDAAAATTTVYVCTRAPPVALVAWLLTQRVVHDHLPLDCSAVLQRYVRGDSVSPSSAPHTSCKPHRRRNTHALPRRC